MNTVAGQELDMCVINETYPVQIDDTEIWRVRLYFADVDHLVDLFFLIIGELECT
jgi:hypothetical protein